MTEPLSPGLLKKIDAYWRAANYLSVGQIYLYDNPMLKVPLKVEHIKPRLLGHFGTTPGLNFIYAHCNRIIKQYDLNMIYIAGPGHGGPGIVANTYLEGTYSELYPNICQDEEGMKALFTQFSFPGGIPSHAAPETPGSIHEGGELGYALSHAFGAAFDNPDLWVCCVIGDGEAETGALATSWHSNKFLNPVGDGYVLPILHLNGYKIAGPTVLARIPHEELEQLMLGYGWKPYFVEGDDPETMHKLMAETMDKIVAEVKQIQTDARGNGFKQRPRWPMIVLKSPKGWTGPKVVDGQQIEGTFRAHQVPLDNVLKDPEHLKQLEAWMKSYRAEELFDETGKLIPELAELAPKGERRMGANPHANGGLLLRDLRLPDFRSYGIPVPKPGITMGEATREQGKFLRDILKLNAAAKNFRVFSPDETASNRLGAVFQITDRDSTAEVFPYDENVDPEGRVMEMLSEHQCEGWLEGYLLTGRHGIFSCYEAFIHIIDSMFNQHAKWLKTTLGIEWRRKIASLNYMLSSHVWRQDHNGFSHQDPGFIDHVVNKKADVVRVYLPPDANTLLSVTDHCLRSRHYVNLVVAGKQPSPQWLDMESAVKHCSAGIGMWEWAGNDDGRRTRRRDGLLRGRPDTGNDGRRLAHPHPFSRPESARGERRRPDETPAGVGASARPERPRFRRALHQGQARHLRLSRLPHADSSTDLPPDESQQYPRPRVSRKWHDDHAFRHGGAELSRPVSPGRRRGRPRPHLRPRRRPRETIDSRQADRAPRVRQQTRRRFARGPRLEMADPAAGVAGCAAAAQNVAIFLNAKFKSFIFSDFPCLCFE